MKITLNENGALTDTEVIINCPCVDEDILKIISTLRVYDRKITGIKNDSTYIIDVKDILYIDTADKKTFFYTENDVFESALRLYELEERLVGLDFFRASKSSVVNFMKIESIRPELGGRIILTMENGENLFVSRQYAKVLKEKLGLMERRKSK